MRKFKFLSLSDNQAEIDAAQAALDPMLAKAGIKEINIGGKVFHFDNAEEKGKIALAEQIKALAALSPATSTQDISLIIQDSENTAKLATEAQEKLETANTNVATLTREKLAAEEKLKTAENTIASMTRDNANLTNQLDAAIKQHGKALSEQNASKTALAAKCLAANCLDLNGDDGKPLPNDATQESKMAAAMKLSYGDLFKAFNGAVNAAVAKVGVTFADIPSGKPSNVNDKKELKGRERFAAFFKIAQ